MQEIVKELSYSDRKELVREIRKYSASFSRVVDSVLSGFSSIGGVDYDSLLKAGAEKEFPNAKQPMHNIVHWMLLDNGLIDYSASVSRNGEPDSSIVSRKYNDHIGVEKAVRKDVKRYIITILARAEGTERADKFVPKKVFHWNGQNSNGQPESKKD